MITTISVQSVSHPFRLSTQATYRGRLERIIGGEGNKKEENTARVRRVTLFHIRCIMSDSHTKVPVRSLTHGAHNRCLPLEHVIASRAGAAGRGVITLHIPQFLEKRKVPSASRSEVRWDYDNTFLMRLRVIDNICKTWTIVVAPHKVEI